MAAPVSAQAEVSAIYTLEVNRVTKGDVIVLVRGDDVLIPLQDLVNAGLRRLAVAAKSSKALSTSPCSRWHRR